MMPEKLEYDTPIEVNILQYKNIMSKCRGMVCGRKDEDGKYWIKVWMMKYEDFILKQFKL